MLDTIILMAGTQAAQRTAQFTEESADWTRWLGRQSSAQGTGSRWVGTGAADCHQN